MRRGILVAFGLAAMAGLYLMWIGGWVILAIGVVSIAAALGYTNGPIPYGYRGLGELFVFLFFGLVATVGTRYVFDRTAPEAAWIAAIPMGLLAAAILVANNLRDIDTDRAAGKRTLAVMMGRAPTRVFYAVLLHAGYAIVIGAALFDGLPAWTLLTLLTMPLSVRLSRVAAAETAGPPLIGVLKGTARLQLVFAVLLAAGIVA
jgi:1,4-dihydroxy-2-naphthoate octaprenyltransferase